MTIGKSIAAVVMCGIFCGIGASAQQPSETPATGQQQNQQQGQQQPATNPNAKVIFSRSDDDAVEKPEGTRPAADASANIKATDADRAAITFTAYDLDVHLAPRDHTLAVRARLEVRNDGDQPLKVIPLQISSSLHFEGVSLDGKRLSLGQQTLNSDVDHTGQLHEAVVELPSVLAPGASLKLETAYSGEVELDARRLLQLGTPEEVAERSDWDRISESFTGLRGFGNVVWYPVSTLPALLGDGAKVFAAIGGQKLRQSDATVAMRVSVEFFGAPPSVAVLDGHTVTISKPTAMPTAEYPGVVECSLAPTKLGFAVPSLFVASRTLAGDNTAANSDIRVYAREENVANAQGVLTAATMVRPLMQQWLGGRGTAADAKPPLTVLDLPEAEDATYEEGGVLLAGITSDAPEKIAEMMSHALAHAYFQSPRQWLNEGVPSFLGTLWIEQTHDRDLALEKMESSRGALAFAEPGTPGAGPGQDLIHATDAVYYQTKAAYVLWMLRDVAGDKELAAALQAYKATDDTTPEYFEHLLEKTSGKDLKWFFDNWVYRDRGLPDLSIAGVYPSPSEHDGAYLVAVDISNDGFAEAEVSVTLRSRQTTLTERVRLPGKTRTVHRMLIQGHAEDVTVNDGTVPEVQAAIHKRTLVNQ
jgi:hypothetical protein